MAYVVLVEDDALTARLVAEVISALGHRVFVAGSIAEALDRVGGETGVVLIDVNPGTESGLDLMVALSASSETGHVPLVAMTGSDEPETLAALDRLGIVAMLEKPFNGAEIALLVQAVLESGPKSKRPRCGGL